MHGTMEFWMSLRLKVIMAMFTLQALEDNSDLLLRFFGFSNLFIFLNLTNKKIPVWNDHDPEFTRMRKRQ